jgi:hypothetical protein
MAEITVTNLMLNAVGRRNAGPLNGLAKTLGISTFQYPSDLGTDGSKKHYVTFLAKEIVPQTYAITEGAKNIGVAVYNAGAAAGQYLESTAKQALNMDNNGTAATGTSNVTDAAPKVDGTPVIGALASASKAIQDNINNLVSITKNRQAINSIIALYMPDTLQATYKADYASFSLRDELAGPLNNIRGVASIAQAGLNASENPIDAMSSDPAAIKFALDTLFGGKDLSSGILQTQGYASNPQLQMIYHGAPFRSFTLNFVFTPKSMAEANEVEEIIHKFKYYAAPELKTAGQTNSMFLIPPALFEIKFYYDGSENLKLPKYADCVLEDIQIDYAPNGFAAHTDGAPIQTHLSLSFHEVEIVDKARLDKGYNGIDGGLR